MSFSSANLISNLAPGVDGFLNQAIENLFNLRQPFEKRDVRFKRKIVGSIFLEKLSFDEINYRTARVNEVVLRIYSLDAAFSENKNGETDKNFDFSTLVTPTGTGSNQFMADLRLLAEIEEVD